MELDEMNDMIIKSNEKHERSYDEVQSNRPKLQRRKSQENIEKAIELLLSARDKRLQGYVDIEANIDEALALLEACK